MRSQLWSMKSFQCFCMWAVAHLFKILKRRRWVLALLGAICALMVVILFRWGFMCTNTQSLQHIHNLCTKYARGEVVGNLCQELCKPGEVSDLSCHNFHMGKEVVLSGKWRDVNVVLKLPKKTHNDPLYSMDTSSNKMQLTEHDFCNMIKHRIKLKFNISVNKVDVKRLSYMPHNVERPLREVEMENVWSLLQDNEYLALSLYENLEIFPKLVGTCGPMFAVQRLNSISRFWHLMTLYDSKEEWEKRVKISVKIMDFLLKLETGLPEPLHICDVKMNHFGVTDDFKMVQFLDLDSVHPRSIVNKVTGDGSNCKQHSDCDFFDCRSFCNLITHKCQHGVANNNLQIVCEKIFLGWVMSGRVMVPGLLLGPRTPRVLIELLELCANPDNEIGTPRAPASKEIRKRLHNLLVHLTP